MFNSYDDVVKFVGNMTARSVRDLPGTRVRRTFGRETRYALAYKGQYALKYYPSHVTLGTPTVSSAHGNALRKRIEWGLPAGLTIRNQKGKAYIVDTFGRYHSIVKNMVFGWDGRVIKPWNHPGSKVLMYIKDMYISLGLHDLSMFPANDCFICGTTLPKHPVLGDCLSYVLELDYHFYEHLQNHDVGLNTLLEMCEAYWRYLDLHPENIARRDISLGLAGVRELDGADFMNMEAAFRWFFNEKMDIIVEDL